MPGGLSRVNAGHEPLRCSFNKPIFFNFFSPRRTAAPLSLSPADEDDGDDDGGGGGDEAFLFSIPPCTEESDAW